MKVKIVYGSDIRRWYAPEENKYEALVHFVRSTFDFPSDGNFFLQFEDDEGDRMTVQSSGDLADAFQIAQQEGRKSLKIFLTPVSIQEARQEAMSQFSGSRSVISSFGTASVADFSDFRATEPEVEPEPEPELEDTRTWKEQLTDFLREEAVAAALPDFVRAVMKIIRINNAGFDVAVLHAADQEQFAVIGQHKFFEEFVKPNLSAISAQTSQLMPVVLMFDDDHIASIVPQLVDAGVQMFSGASDVELDVGPIFSTLFPQWMETMNANNPEGAIVDLSHLFGVGGAAEVAAAMMSGCPSQASDEIAVHQGIICDMCDTKNIRGARYKCCVCEDFDLCEDCAATGRHNRNHPLLKLSVPTRGLCRREMHGLREMLHRGRPWGGMRGGCRRGRRGGRRGGCPWRKFQCKRQERQQPETEAAKPAVDAVNKVFSCPCGSELVKMHHRAAYRVNAKIFCDLCGKLARGADEIYHCPNEFSSRHPEGYDICVNCGDDQLRAAVAVPVVEKKEKEDVVPVMAVMENVEVEVNPTAPPAAEAIAEEQYAPTSFPFQRELESLMAMGFRGERLRNLLVESKGDVNAVVERLLSA